jgi:hypothetical protein
MVLLIGLAVASFAGVGLAIFLLGYRGTRARAAGLSAFALGLAVIAGFLLMHVTIGTDHPMVWLIVLLIHVAMCLVELLLLGAVLSLRDPPSALYWKVETALGLTLAALAVVVYGGVAWWVPQHQDEVPRLVFFAIPPLIGVAVVARFGLSRDGLVGGGVFLALVVSNLLYLFGHPQERERGIVRPVAECLQMAGYLGILMFFYLAASNAGLARTPWPGGSLGLNRTRVVSAGLLVLGLAACGYFLWEVLERGSAGVPMSLLPGAAFAACLVGVVGLMTGRILFRRGGER